MARRSALTSAVGGLEVEMSEDDGIAASIERRGWHAIAVAEAAFAPSDARARASMNAGTASQLVPSVRRT